LKPVFCLIARIDARGPVYGQLSIELHVLLYVPFQGASPD
jgi:hypothetical protein